MEILSLAECERLLTAGGVGILAVGRGEAPVLRPVNFAVHERSVWLRTGEGRIRGREAAVRLLNRQQHRPPGARATRRRGRQARGALAGTACPERLRPGAQRQASPRYALHRRGVRPPHRAAERGDVMARGNGGEVALDRWGRDPTRATQWNLLGAAYRSWFRVEWEGIEHLPREGGALLVSNHAGMMPVDGALIQIGVEEQLGRLVYLLAHHGFFRFPFLGRMMNRAGTICANPDNAHRLLREDGRLVLVFPEGEKGRPPSSAMPQRFGRAARRTAMCAGVPIVSIALMGTESTPTVGVLELAGQRMPISVNALLFGPLLARSGLNSPRIRARVPPVASTWASCPRTAQRADGHAEAIRSDLQRCSTDGRRASKWFG
jgi:1-acyl-sn-glycerol-3-phosphate acyltransferase